MSKGIYCAVGLILIVVTATACGSAPSIPPAPVAAPTNVPTGPNSTATITPSAGAPSSTTPPDTATPSVSDTPIPTTTPAPPTPVIPDGLYVTTLDIVPDPPTRGSELLFYATFANTTGSPQSFRWTVYIYTADNLLKSFGETTANQTNLDLGASTQKSAGFWKLPLGGPCQDFVARVALIDQDNQSSPFLHPNGQVFQRLFAVCAPGDLPAVTATLTGQPTVTRTPAPGVFVTDLRTDPNPPTRGSNLTFHATFSNTTGTVQNLKWLVTIYPSDNPNTAIAQTTVTSAAFPAGSSEQQSVGSWKLALGGPCEDYAVQVVSLDQNNQPVRFNQPTGAPFQKLIRVCPP